jgi:2-oxoisovalerate dehydrogenase E1 component
LLKAAIRSNDPVVFMEHRAVLGLRGPVPDVDADEVLPFGCACVRRQGQDVTVVGIAHMVTQALAAAAELEAAGVSVEVIDPRSLAPLDIDTILASVAKTGRLLVVDEDYAPCGVGAEIAAQVADRGFNDLDAPVRRLNSRHAPVPYSPPLEAALIPTPASITQAIQDLLAE